MSLKDYASHSSGLLLRNLAVGLHWKETQGYGILLGKLRSSCFLDKYRDRITISTLTLMWKKNLWIETYSFILRALSALLHVLACCNWLYFIYFIKSKRNKVWFPYDLKKETKEKVFGWVRRFSEPWKWPQFWLKNSTRMKNGMVQAPGRCCRDELQMHFILRCY